MTVSLFNILCFVFLLKINCHLVESRNYSVEEKIRNDPDLSEFYSLLENNHVANATLSYRTLTVFAPTNQAFQNFKRTPARESLVSYHMATLPLKVEQIYSGQQIATDFDGNPPLWLTRTHRNDIYVNNARILPKSNYEAYNPNGKKQVLHIISEVLQPVLMNNPATTLYNPDAYQFLNQSESISVGPHRVRSFRQRIILTRKEQIYKDDGRFTFFIPVDEGFTSRVKRESYGIPPHFGGSVFFNVSYRSFAAKVCIEIGLRYENLSMKRIINKGDLNRSIHRTESPVMQEVRPLGPQGLLLSPMLDNKDKRNGVDAFACYALKTKLLSHRGFFSGCVRAVPCPCMWGSELLEGAHTGCVPCVRGFFPPCGEQKKIIILTTYNRPPPRPEKIDAKVIDGHVIPDYVLFTGPTAHEKEYKTLAFGDMIKVTISFTQQNDGKHSKIYVKSNTVVGDDNHPTGVVLAEIVLGNIPVKNGVVHLIHRPLMVVDTTVEQFLKEKVDGPLYRFHKIIIDAGGDFMERINRRGYGITLFAPSNTAWNESYLEGVLEDKEKLRQILDLHLVEAKLPMETIIHNNANEIFQVATSSRRQNLYFNVIQGPHNNLTLTVEGGGVNATVIQPDIAAVNGVVHIIDRVLGVPFMTVREKLATDPMLNDTYFLGERTGFNGQLKNLNHKFTYFVPRDLAWKKAKLAYPSAHKKLFMRQYDYHVRQILERHLVIHDKAYTMAELKQMHNDTFTLPTLRDSLRLKIKEIDITQDEPDYFIDNYEDYDPHGINSQSSLPGPRKAYALDWRGETIPVFRADVYCTNGIIHVIDKVLLQDSDIRVNGANGIKPLSNPAFSVGLMILIKFYLN